MMCGVLPGKVMKVPTVVMVSPWELRHFCGGREDKRKEVDGMRRAQDGLEDETYGMAVVVGQGKVLKQKAAGVDIDRHCVGKGPREGNMLSKEIN